MHYKGISFSIIVIWLLALQVFNCELNSNVSRDKNICKSAYEFWGCIRAEFFSVVSNMYMGVKHGL
jgi:hypothetical protein